MESPSKVLIGPPVSQEKTVISASESLERLRERNRRFTSDVRSLEAMVSPTRRAELAAGQQSHAIIVGCFDSRVPAELVFDQGLETCS